MKASRDSSDKTKKLVIKKTFIGKTNKNFWQKFIIRVLKKSKTQVLVATG